jgi:hypothetical protein
MITTAKLFTAEELASIDKADDLKISPFRKDGATFGTPTWIWEVVVDGQLYVRAYNGTASSWYRSILKQQGGRIHAAGMVKDVVFIPIHDEDVNRLIDQAYQEKYNKSAYMSHMINGKARQATVMISPP